MHLRAVAMKCVMQCKCICLLILWLIVTRPFLRNSSNTQSSQSTGSVCHKYDAISEESASSACFCKSPAHIIYFALLCYLIFLCNRRDDI